MSDGICHGRPKITADGTHYVFKDRAGKHHFHTPTATVPVGPQTSKLVKLDAMRVCCRCGRTVIIDVDAKNECVGPFVVKGDL